MGMYLDQTAAPTPAVPLKESVSTGNVSLDHETGDRLTKLLNYQMDMADSWLERIGRLARPAPLGTNPVGAAMSEKFENAAGGDETSFLAVITAYREVLRQTQDAVSGAMRNLTNADDDQAATFRTQIV
ncbi:hypothetical protein Lesp02_44030 [Lentzea sp. NBRC 105346]|uniref:hypothetical protein n=1 Tax=Lentzea sp. NBRC 105346 TaxID=3032205 RepID=UPI0024A27201|nr:hypothetical protein [Lentzea sp. NBRC 105346]GLZ32215.1 hypothetical protein Lesp02_44030 [Lentzea sp. NBRC 105346]